MYLTPMRQSSVSLKLRIFETLVTNGKRTSENAQHGKFAENLLAEVRLLGFLGSSAAEYPSPPGAL
jgi:hypothetical protein